MSQGYGAGYGGYVGGGVGGAGYGVGVNQNFSKVSRARGGFHFDQIIASNLPPMLQNGVYNFSGGEAAAIYSFNNFPNFYQGQINLNAGQPIPIHTVQLFIVGNQTSEGNKFIACATVCLGMCLIFPYFFTCCSWYKKLTEPLYEISNQTYQRLIEFLDSMPRTVTNVNIQIVDNGFNAEKAALFYNFLSRRQLTGFTFTNNAVACNYH